MCAACECVLCVRVTRDGAKKHYKLGMEPFRAYTIGNLWTFVDLRAGEPSSNPNFATFLAAV